MAQNLKSQEIGLLGWRPVRYDESRQEAARSFDV